MAYNIPTTQELVTRNIAFIESKLNQSVPDVDKAYNRTTAVLWATIQTSLFKMSAERGLQCLALTATGDDLDNIGFEYDVIRKAATAAEMTGTIPTTTTVTLPQSYSFIGDNNSVRYFPDSSYLSVANVITANVTAEDLGISGNLNVGDTMEMSTQLVGSSTTLTITEITTIGAEEETDDSYRQRILTEIRTIKGGGNSADYRRWSESVSGVEEAFPYAGLPYPEDPLDAVPPDRVVYVEATSDIDADGIAPSTLLDSVRDAINTDQTTGLDNEPLGLVDESLYVTSIRRTTLYLQIQTLDVPASEEAATKTSIEAAFETYARGIKPFVDGLDFEGDRNDIISDLIISRLVQDILDPVGGTASGVGFGLTVGIFLPAYTLSEGELAKSGGVSYV